MDDETKVIVVVGEAKMIGMTKKRGTKGDERPRSKTKCVHTQAYN